ncbi:hypothetical protein [Pseudonocardia sp. NPDC049635]|uniref:hypothetical protein n=1 Tax=Pseudonocardia sp. NPDC049635 TaxID=3155506 RepID=UPI0034022505
MSERRRGRNGAKKRYKGPRELVGTRVPPQFTDRVDEARGDLGLTRNDYLFAALVVAIENPDAIRAAAATLEDMLPQRRTSPASEQLAMAGSDDEEDFARTA